jgi:hypothetical protein
MNLRAGFGPLGRFLRAELLVEVDHTNAGSFTNVPFDNCRTDAAHGASYQNNPILVIHFVATPDGGHICIRPARPFAVSEFPANGADRSKRHPC